MKFQWPQWLDPRRIKWDAVKADGIKDAYSKTKAWVLANRTLVISSGVSLAVGLFAGLAMGAGGGGGATGGGGGILSAFGGGGESARSASAPRAGLPQVQGMAFVRLRTETTSAEPRACIEFSQALSRDANVHYSDYIEMSPAAQFGTEISDNLLCLTGLSFEPEHDVTLRAGIPAQNGDKTEAEEHFVLSFGDRPAYVGFAGDGVILPRTEADGIAIETVNVSKLSVEVLRVPDRILSQQSIETGETNEEGGWGGWSFNYAGSDVGVSVYKGEIDIDSAAHRNQPMTSVFALGAAVGTLRPGAYVVKVKDASPGAGGNGRNYHSEASSYRWVLYTDMALQTFSGASGVDVVVRSLKTAQPVSGATITLIAQNNEELGRVRSDRDGHVHFDKALVEGEGPSRARYVMSYFDGDFAALDLNRPGLDLSDRNVDGRRAPGDIDAYLYTERGVYRPGERVRLMGLIRDRVGRAIADRPSTLVVYRPNGTEWRRMRLTEAEAAGAIAKNIDLARSSPRGQWRADILVDGQEAVAGSVSFSVEDFVPQRLRVTFNPTPEQLRERNTVLRSGQSLPIGVQADFLYGAPGGGLAVEGEARLTIDPTPFPDFKDYAFGKQDEDYSERLISLPSTVTDGEGHGELIFAANDIPATTLPLRARITASVADPGGRMVREGMSVPVRTNDIYFGIKPRFENRRAGVGERTALEVVAVNAQGQRVGVQGVQWQLVREDWGYDWYLDNGDWHWRRTGRDIPVDGATVNIAANAPLVIARDELREGSYRLVVGRPDLQPSTKEAASFRFGVGWGGPAEDQSTPDMVTVVGPDEQHAVRPGGRARVQIKPPYAGEAQIVVATDRVLSTQTVRVGENGANVDLPVTAEWGSGAYVLVTVMTPRNPVNLPIPRRAVGVTYVPVDMGQRTLTVEVGQGLANVRPRTHVDVPIQVRGAPNGERVRVMIAAVDEGILNITKYESPNPVDYFFSRRALGVDIRDDYGRLLNPNLGAPATARQGGDSIGGEGLTVVPTKTVSLFSDMVEVRGGRATIPLDIPDYNGTLRFMAVAWSASAVGQDSEQVIVRDPVVAELILPRFIAPGDVAQGALNIDNVEGPNGAYTVTITGQGPATLRGAPQRFTLNRGQRQTALIPITGGALGVGNIHLKLDGPSGFASVERDYPIQSRAPYMPITVTETRPLNAGASWRAPNDALAQFLPEMRNEAQISFSNFPGFDPAPILEELYRYPYWCSEQLTSISMPLLYFNTLAGDVGVAQDNRLRRRVQEAITDLLDRQDSTGSFGLWHAGDGYASPWLGAYIVDFLSRAKEKGYAIPSAQLDAAYQSLMGMARLNDFNSANYSTFVFNWPGTNDSEDLLKSRSAAYALYVLARNNRADIGQLRYYHDNQLSKEPSPLARAQIAAGLAHMGDRARAHHAFQMAEQALGYRNIGDWYQTPLRDTAGVMALAAEAGEVELIDRLRQRLERDVDRADYLMTQEQVRLLMAAYALRERSGEVNVSLNGARMSERRIVADAQRLAQGLAFRNNSTRGEVWRTLQTFGSPRTAPPAQSSGYSLNKRVYRMDGSLADLNSIRQGDRVVIVLSGRPDGERLYPTVAVDMLPAGLEIETLLGPADGQVEAGWDGIQRNGAFAWIGEISNADVSEARDDRFVASQNLHDTSFLYAYVARAVTPGRYAMPGANIEDMYRPGVFARTAVGTINIAPRGG